MAKLVVGMLGGRMLQRWCPDDDVLAKRYLEDKFGVDPATLVDPETLEPRPGVAAGLEARPPLHVAAVGEVAQGQVLAHPTAHILDQGHILFQGFAFDLFR